MSNDHRPSRIAKNERQILARVGPWPVLTPADPGSGFHIAAVGPSGTFKTSAMIIPACYWHTDGPLVVTSTKPDILDQIWKVRLLFGNVHVLDLRREPGAIPYRCHSIRWSLARKCRNYDTATDRSRDVVETMHRAGGTDSAFWSARGIDVLAPALMAANIAGMGLEKMTQSLRTSDMRDLVQVLQGSNEPHSSEAASTLQQIVAADPRHRGDAVATALSSLSALRGSRLKALAGVKDDEWDPEAFVTSRDTVVIIAPLDESASLAPLVVGFLGELHSAIRKEADKRGGRLPHRLLFALDECCSIAPWPLLPRLTAEIGSKNVTLMLACQSWSQMRERFGSENAATIWTNCRYRVVHSESDHEQLRLLESLAGTTVRETAGQGDRGGQSRDVPAISASQFAHTRKGHVWVFGPDGVRLRSSASWWRIGALRRLVRYAKKFVVV